MREFKFRAWDGCKMCAVKALEFTENEGTVVTKDDGYFGYAGSDLKLMQSTEFPDKNGREIYEGDIVRFSPYWVEHPWTSRVVWGREYAGHVVKGKADDSEEDVLDCEMVEDAEVIGNIYENPELLEADQ